jgi:arsenate reductase (glutaredoxin)
MIVYHNPRCSKSREAVELLNGMKCEFQIREYLKEHPSVKELKALVSKLACKPFDLVRKKEKLYLEEYADKKITDAQWYKILSENPILIERPIVIGDTKAVIGRPPELVLDLVKKKK